MSTDAPLRPLRPAAVSMGVPPAPDCPESDWGRLFARVQADDQAAFAELHLLSRRHLYCAAYSVVRSADLAQDVLQDAYLTIWSRRHLYEPDRGSVKGWMTVITRRRAVDRLRSAVRTQTLQLRFSSDPTSAAETDHQVQVTDTVHAAALIAGAFAELTQTQREALQLTYWDGWTAVQAAELLGIPLPTLKSRLHSATRRLRGLLVTLPTASA